jgi:hypothetical protein
LVEIWGVQVVAIIVVVIEMVIVTRKAVEALEMWEAVDVFEEVGLEAGVEVEDDIKLGDDVEIVEAAEPGDDVEVEDDVESVVLEVVPCPMTVGTAFGPDPICTIFSDVAPNTAGARWACLLSRSKTTYALVRKVSPKTVSCEFDIIPKTHWSPV